MQVVCEALTVPGKSLSRKRHILVDTEGHLLVAVVHAANLDDRDGGRLVFEAVGTAFPRLQWIGATKGT
jgi:putative transposase